MKHDHLEMGRNKPAGTLELTGFFFAATVAAPAACRCDAQLRFGSMTRLPV